MLGIKSERIKEEERKESNREDVNTSPSKPPDESTILKEKLRQLNRQEFEARNNDLLKRKRNPSAQKCKSHGTSNQNIMNFETQTLGKVSKICKRSEMVTSDELKINRDQFLHNKMSLKNTQAIEDELLLKKKAHKSGNPQLYMQRVEQKKLEPKKEKTISSEIEISKKLLDRMDKQLEERNIHFKSEEK